MRGTRGVLRKMATVIKAQGLHTGEQFAHHGVLDQLDICALAYVVAEDCPPPVDFFTDEVASIRLIECSAGAMLAIQAISAVLDTEPCTTQIAPGYEVPDYIEHVSVWAMTPPVFETRPPSVSEVIGRILRAANQTNTGRIRLLGQAANHRMDDPKGRTTSCGLAVPLHSRVLAPSARITCRLCQAIDATPVSQPAA